MSLDELVRRYPHLRGGSAAFRRLSSGQKLKFLRGPRRAKVAGASESISCSPRVPATHEPFELVCAHAAGRKGQQIVLIRVHVRLPSGKTHDLDYRPRPGEVRAGRMTIPGFQSGSAGDLYVSARIYFRDGSTASDAFLTTVLSRNPHQLIISPRNYLVSGNAGLVEYDWDKNEFHCRANGTITNGEGGTVTYNRCRVRVTDGGVGGTLIEEFSFAAGPFTVAPGGTAYRVIDTSFPKGNAVWNRFNERWDLTLQFTYETGVRIAVSDAAVYRPMSTVPINAIKCADFTAKQTQAERDAVAIAAELLEARDITLFNPNWRIISSAADKAKYGTFDIGWKDGKYDYAESGEMYSRISGPEQDRLDVFVPLGIAYSAEVPADRRNVGGVSTVKGPFPKDDDPPRSGCMVLLNENDVDFFGVAIAHEICHYLGLEHVADSVDDNLMHKNGGLTGHELTWEQWDQLRQHGMMKWLAFDI
jgi:hypothetical protein